MSPSIELVGELRKEIASRDRQIAALTKERDEAREWAVKSVREVEARERIMTCVWCAHEYPPMTPAAQAPILYEHAKACPKSPLAGLLAALEAGIGFYPIPSPARDAALAAIKKART